MNIEKVIKGVKVGAIALSFYAVGVTADFFNTLTEDEITFKEFQSQGTGKARVVLNYRLDKRMKELQNSSLPYKVLRTGEYLATKLEQEMGKKAE